MSGVYLAEPYDQSDPVVRESAMQAAVEAIAFDRLVLHDDERLENAQLQAINGRLEYASTSVGAKTLAYESDLTDYQPVDSGLTAIAALTTTAYGRALLTLANQAALQAAVVASQTGTGSTFVMSAGPTFTGTTTIDTLVVQNAANSSRIFNVKSLAGTEILYVDSVNRNVVAGGDAFAVRSTTGGTYLYNNGFIGWAPSSSASTGTPTSTISQNASGVVQIGTTAANALGSLACASITTSSFVQVSGSMLTDSVYGSRTGTLQFGGTNGKMRWTNNAGTVGMYFDFTTADTLILRNLADSAGGNIQVGKVVSGAGTLAAPSITLGDSGTGFYRIAANQFGVACNGVDTFRFSTGNVVYCFQDFVTYGKLQFGTQTNTTPMLKKSGTTLSVRLSDDSADASITASNITASGATILGTKTIATLPSAASSNAHRYQVTDSPTVANRIAFSNGSAWYYEGTAVAV